MYMFWNYYIAAFSGNYDLVEYLIKEGVNVNPKNKSGDTPLHKAACWGNVEIFKLLVNNNANINEKNSYEDTPLHDG